MLLSEQVVNGLNGVECAYGHFYEDCAPVAHGSIPQARQLKSREFLAVLALRADEARVVVDMLEEVEAIALVVLCSAHEVNRVEVGTVLEHGNILGIIGVDLT